MNFDDLLLSHYFLLVFFGFDHIQFYVFSFAHEILGLGVFGNEGVVQDDFGGFTAQKEVEDVRLSIIYIFFDTQ